MSTLTPNFDVGKHDLELIEQCAKRAMHEINIHLAEPRPMIHYVMDLVETHMNGCPLDLHALLHSRMLDFVHDISGIRAHLDRSTGKLDGLFEPRCAKHIAEVA